MGDVVVVTGATGYVGTELVKQLLDRGYTVRGTVRSLKDPTATAQLQALASALPGRLELFEADLLQPGSFDAAVAGSKFVFHTASPFFIEASDPQAQLVDPAVKGTQNVLSSAVKAKDSVRRVVLTSSVAAVHGGGSKAPPRNGSLYTEEDWNETSSLANGEAYWLGKTLAEREAWRVAQAEGLDLVTICPNFILGPLTSSRTGGTSLGYIKGWLEGKADDGGPTICDIRDVALAHILAAETPAAKGRYIVSQAANITPRFVSETLQARLSQYAIPAGKDAPQEATVDNGKAERDLGLHVRPPQFTLADMAITAVALGVTHTRVG